MCWALRQAWVQPGSGRAWVQASRLLSGRPAVLAAGHPKSSDVLRRLLGIEEEPIPTVTLLDGSLEGTRRATTHHDRDATCGPGCAPMPENWVCGPSKLTGASSYHNARIAPR